MHAYYVAHQSLYTQLPSRDVRHILVKSKTLAQTIYSQLKAGNDKTWCTLAKKYSQDPSSKNNCGKLTVPKGQTVPEFDKVAFSTADEGRSRSGAQRPVRLVRDRAAVEDQAEVVDAREATVANTIRQQLLQQDKNQAMTDWVASLSKSYCSGSKIKYQVGFVPSPDPCTSTTNATTT